MSGGMADISPSDVDVVIYNKKQELYIESITIRIVKKEKADVTVDTTADVDRAMTFMSISEAKGVIGRRNLKGYKAYFYDKNQEIIFKP